jgi:hypothetical protein
MLTAVQGVESAAARGECKADVWTESAEKRFVGIRPGTVEFHRQVHVMVRQRSLAGPAPASEWTTRNRITARR